MPQMVLGVPATARHLVKRVALSTFPPCGLLCHIAEYHRSAQTSGKVAIGYFPHYARYPELTRDYRRSRYLNAGTLIVILALFAFVAVRDTVQNVVMHPDAQPIEIRTSSVAEYLNCLTLRRP